MSKEENTCMCDTEEVDLSNLNCIQSTFNTKNKEEEIASAFTDKIPQNCTMQDDEEMSTQIDFTAENTKFMTIENMMDTRYREFNKTLTDLACLVDVYSADKKTMKYIKNEYLKMYIKFFDVIKYIYNLDAGDTSIVPGTNADKVLFKREVVEPKRVCLEDGRKLHIYVDKDGKYQFIDEVFSCGGGVSLQDLAFWVENRENFADSYVTLESLPVTFQIFGRMAYIPIKGLRIPRSGNPVADRFYAVLGRLHKQIGDILTERKKALAKKGNTVCSDDEYIDDEEEDN